MNPVRLASRLICSVFFRRIDIVGAEQVPHDGPLLFVINHPNALIDPLFVMAYAPRDAFFLAKEPLFRMPVVGWFTRAAGSVPVYRQQDGADTAQNQRTFALVTDRLVHHRALALFPEGTSHSDATLRPLKTGAARMAIAAAAVAHDVRIVPAGLYYTSKSTFRSSAVLAFGAPIAVARTPLDAQGEPQREDVHALTGRIRDGLATITLQAEHPGVLDRVARAERILASMSGPSPRSVGEQFAVRRRILAGRAQLQLRDPAQLADLERQVAEYDALLRTARLSPESVLPARLTLQGVARYTFSALTYLLILLPLAVIGIVIHIVPYHAIKPLITRTLRVEQDVVATGKLLAAAVLFPLTWLLFAMVAWRVRHWPEGVLTLITAPVCGMAAMLFLERLEFSTGAVRGLVLRWSSPSLHHALQVRRASIAEMLYREAEREKAAR